MWILVQRMLFWANDSGDDRNNRHTYRCMYIQMYLQVKSVTFKRLSEGLCIHKRLHIPATEGSKVLEEESGSRKHRKWPEQLSSL